MSHMDDNTTGPHLPSTVWGKALASVPGPDVSPHLLLYPCLLKLSLMLTTHRFLIFPLNLLFNKLPVLDSHNMSKPLYFLSLDLLYVCCNTQSIYDATILLPANLWSFPLTCREAAVVQWLGCLSVDCGLWSHLASAIYLTNVGMRCIPSTNKPCATDLIHRLLICNTHYRILHL